MKNSVRRWVFILNTLRALPYVDMDGEHLEVENKKLLVSYNDTDVNIIDTETGEILITYSEDGSPEYLTDWAEESVQWDAYDYPMYEERNDILKEIKQIAEVVTPGQKVVIKFRGKDVIIDTTGKHIMVRHSNGNRIMMLRHPK